MADTATPTADNGVNVEHLLTARQHLTDDPDLAQFQFRAHCDWVNGTHSRSTVQDFSGLSGEQMHRQSFAFESDHPEIFASADNGATAPEIVLAALGSCLTGGIASVASNRGVKLNSVRATLTGNMDLSGMLGIDGDIRNGFDEVQVTYDIDADASSADIEAIVAQSQKRSPVFDMLSNPTTVTVTVA